MKNRNKQQPNTKTLLKSRIAFRYSFIGAALTGLVLSLMVLIPAKNAKQESQKPARIFAGKVYQDLNGNGMMDQDELPLDSVKVRIFIDRDGDGAVSTGDEVVDSLYTNKNGMYEWQTFMSSTLVVEIDKNKKGGLVQPVRGNSGSQTHK